MKYRKKPIVIEAWQVPENIDHTAELPPVWLVEAIIKGTVIADKDSGCVTIKTLEGDMVGNKLDWIIQGVKGELYPCKPEIFAASYESDGEVKQ
jgi:hypothetical protein